MIGSSTDNEIILFALTDVNIVCPDLNELYMVTINKYYYFIKTVVQL